MDVADASGFRSLYIQGWKILGKSATVTAFKQKDYLHAVQNGSLPAGRVNWQPGVIFTLEIQRSTTYCTPYVPHFVAFIMCSLVVMDPKKSA